MGQLIIWDTDLDSDCDDIAATALVTGFVKSGEATLLAATVASENAFAAPAMRAMLTDAGLSSVPVGAYQGSAIGGPTTSLYSQQVAAQYGNSTETRSSYPNAVAVLRQALAAAPDGSVKIVTGGTLTNIAALLRSSADSISPLNGAQLVAQKVSSINSMGGNFISPTASENNIRFDIDAANFVASSSPVPVIWSGYEVGNSIKTSVPIVGPVDSAFELGWSLSNSQQEGGKRSSWDLTAIQYAIRGPETHYGLGGTGGTLSFNANSYTQFNADAGGRNSYLTKIASDATIASALNAVIASGAAGINRAPMGQIAIGGTPLEDNVLSVTSTLQDPDGNGVLAYRWLRDGVLIPGADGTTYTLVQADVGSVISVRVSYTDGRGNAETITTSTAGTVVNLNDSPAGTVTISGAAVNGSTLTASNTLADEDGLGPISYQWLRDGVPVKVGDTYTIGQDDWGKSVSVRADYIDGQGTVESRTSAATIPIESPQVTPVYAGTAGPDVFTATSTADWTIRGFAGADRLTGSTGADTIEGGADNDTLSGGDGADFLNGGTGSDEMDGGLGSDIFIVDSAADVVKEQTNGGADTVRTILRTYTLTTNVEDLVYAGTLSATFTGNSGANRIKGGNADDVLNGLGGNDVLEGSGGYDKLDGGTGADQMVGGSGNDLYLVDSLGDVVIEEANGGIDRVASSVSINLTANIENLSLTGNGSIDGSGNALNNRIEANFGRNILAGGEGRDTFIFMGGNQQNPTITTGNSASTRDIIVDFEQGLDKIDLSGIDASRRSFFDVYDNDAFTRIGAARVFSGNSAGTLIYHQDLINGLWYTIIEANVDNDAAAEFHIQLAGRITLGSSDFVF